MAKNLALLASWWGGIIFMVSGFTWRAMAA